MATRTIAIKITVDNAGSVSSVKSVDSALKETALSTQKLSQLQEGLTNSFIKGNLAARGISMAYQAVAASFRLAVGGSVELEDTLNRTKVIASLNAIQMGAVKDQVMSLGLQMGVSVNDIATTALEMSKMGVSGDNLAKTLASVTYLSNALGESPAMTGEFIAKIGNAFALTGDQLVHVADQIAYSTGQSAAKINDFRVAFNYAGNSAAAAGVEFSTLAGMMGYLSNKGIQASTMGTGIRQLLLGLQVEGSKAANAIGGTVGTGPGQLSLTQALERLSSLHLKIGEIKSLFSKPSIPVIQALLGNVDDLETFIDHTRTATDEAKRLGEGVGVSAAQGFEKLKNAIIKLTDDSSIVGALGELAKMATKIVTALDAISTHWSVKAAGDGFTSKLKSPSMVGLSTEDMASEWAKYRTAYKAEYEKWLADKNSPALHYGPDKGGFSLGLQKLLEPNGPWANPPSTDEPPHVKQVAHPTGGNGKQTKKEEMDAWINTYMNGRGQTDIGPDNPLYAGLINGPDAPSTKGRDKGIMEQPYKKQSSALDHFRKQAEDTKITIMSLVTYTDMADKAVVRFSDEFGDRMSKSLLGMKNGFKGFSDFLESFVQNFIAQMISMITQMLIFKTIAVGLGIITGGGSVAAMTTTDGVIGNTLMASSGSVGHYATGGEFTATGPTSFMAGESGRERVSIVPASKVSSGASMASTTIVIQGDVHDFGSFDRKVKNALNRNRNRYV